MDSLAESLHVAGQVVPLVYYCGTLIDGEQRKRLGFDALQVHTEDPIVAAHWLCAVGELHRAETMFERPRLAPRRARARPRPARRRILLALERTRSGELTLEELYTLVREVLSDA